MSKVMTLYKYQVIDRLFGRFGWSINKIYDDWNHVYSDAYSVEIPDEFYLGENVAGDTMFFKEGKDLAYDLCIGDEHCENGNPYLVGNSEMVKLKVLGPVPGGKITHEGDYETERI